MNIKKTAVTTAIALGTLAGSFTLASALSPTDTAPPAPAPEQTTQGDTVEVAEPDLGGSIQAPETEGVSEAEEAEAASDEADDGVDHQFEGEETGENGDGVPDADDALEAPEVTTGN